MARVTALPHAANDDGRSHDLASFCKHIHSLSRLPVRNLAWLSQQLQDRAFTGMTIGELITLIDRARTLPQLASGQGGVQ